LQPCRCIHPHFRISGVVCILKCFSGFFNKQPPAGLNIDSSLKLIIKEIREMDKDKRVIKRVRRIIKKVKFSYVLFSGGKDSLTVLSLVKKACDSLQLELEAIHVDTTIAIPENLEYVKRICRQLGVKLNVARPTMTFFELALRKGFPTFRRRWCCEYLKLRPVQEFLKNKPASRVVFDGTRAEESLRRKSIQFREWKNFLNCYLYHPILDWAAQDVNNYIAKEKLPINPLYSKGFKRAAECWCGLYKSVEEFRLLRQHYPEMFNKLLNLENSMRNGGSFLFIHGKRIYLRDL